MRSAQDWVYIEPRTTCGVGDEEPWPS